jgi:hypothetical protein
MMRAILLRVGFLLALVPAWPSALIAGETTTYTFDPLGRLAIAKSAGSVNNTQTRSYCLDAAGNRTTYKSALASTPTCAPTPASISSPTAPTTPSNTAPVANANTKSVGCLATALVNLTANDTDADGDLPLALTTASVTSGSASVALASATSVEVTGAAAAGTTTVSYTVADARGATDSGTLTITTTTTCP